MSTIAAIKCAELFWKLDSCQLEYRCVLCRTRFYSHSDCFWHIQRCLQLETATCAGREVIDDGTRTEPDDADDKLYWDPLQKEFCKSFPTDQEDDAKEIYETIEIEYDVYPNSSEEKHQDDELAEEHSESQHYNDVLEYSQVKVTRHKSTKQAKPQKNRLPQEVTASISVPIEDGYLGVPEIISIEAIKSEHNHVLNNSLTSIHRTSNTLSPLSEEITPQVYVPTPEIINPDALSFSRLLLRHLANKWVTCEICDYRIVGRTRMFKHMRRYHIAQPTKTSKPKKYCCEICGIRMALLSNLRVHMRIHTGEKPFACLLETCDRRFSGTSERTIHMRVHRGEKPFKCDQCSKAFHNKNHLKVHLRTRHSNDRPFSCDECGQSFKLRDVFRKHMLTHTEVRPYHCDVCGRSFRQRSAFQVHVNIHNDHRPFKCSLCEQGFHSSSARRSHEKKTHKVP